MVEEGVPSQVFTTDDTSLYATWHKEDGGVVCLYVPGVGAVRMSLAKAEELGADISRQAEYGRWAAMEARHDESQSQKNPSA